SGRGDLPRQPEQKRRATPVERLHEGRVLEDETPEPERHHEHHGAHTGGHTEQAGQASDHAGVGARRREHDVARTRRDGSHQGEEEKRHHLFCRRTLPSTEMSLNDTRSAGEGLERSCQGTVAGWLASSRPADGVELLSAWFAGEAYQKHRHDTYAIGVT